MLDEEANSARSTYPLTFVEYSHLKASKRRRTAFGLRSGPLFYTEYNISSVKLVTCFPDDSYSFRSFSSAFEVLVLLEMWRPTNCFVALSFPKCNQ